jgi:hypothetical protein
LVLPAGNSVTKLPSALPTKGVGLEVPSVVIVPVKELE